MTKLLLEKFAQQLETGRPLRWLDWIDYGQKVILNDRDIPWGDPVALVHFLSQGQSLLKLDVTGLPLANYFDWWLSTHPDIKASMSGKKRVGFALKTFLANGTLRRDLTNLIAIAAAASSTPLILTLPSPRQLLVWAHEIANQLSDIEADDLMSDSASVYLADFLREFAEHELAGILLLEADNAALSNEQIDLYRPIANVCNGYQWAIGTRTLGSPGSSQFLDFMITDANVPCQIVANPLASSFWSGDTSAAGDFVYGEIPADAVPENVLDALATLDSK